ncbi:hypothetical protein JXJ21_12580 [candidate division KSB1 bacterium]|nr:hypothetical protein [candidate division KSB1 bacterium]
MMKNYSIIIALCVVGVLGTTAVAQPQFNYPAYNAAISTYLSYRSWAVKQGGTEQKISQLVVPFSVLRPVTQNIDVYFSTSNASSMLKSESDYKLNGMTDGKFKAFWRLAENSVMLSLGLGMPFGKNSFNESENQVANALYETVLGFKVKRYGEGFDADLGAVYARNFGGTFTIGFGVGYLFKGEYNYQTDSEIKFKPGDELSIHGGVDIELDSIFIRANVLHTRFGVDKLDGEQFLTEGSQTEIEALFHYHTYPISFSIFVNNIIKQENGVSGDLGRALLIGRNFIDNSFLSQAQFMFNLNPSFSFGGKFGFNKFGKSDIQVADAWTIHSGPEFYAKFSETMIVRTDLMYLTGEAEANTITLNGWQTTIAFSFRF